MKFSEFLAEARSPEQLFTDILIALTGHKEYLTWNPIQKLDLQRLHSDKSKLQKLGFTRSFEAEMFDLWFDKTVAVDVTLTLKNGILEYTAYDPIQDREYSNKIDINNLVETTDMHIAVAAEIDKNVGEWFKD